MTKRIGFACKLSEVNADQEVVAIPEYNSRSTTVAWLNRQSKDVAVEKLWELTQHNITAAKKAVEYVGNMEKNLRMFRLGSDILPMYTQRDWKFFYKLPYVNAFLEAGFREVGDMARKNNVRLSMHPGQFCVLASDNPGVVENSIEEFEYHADMARWMGYGKQFQDFKINVHISGRAGPAGIKAALKRLTPEARNCITIENDEVSWGIEDSLELANDLALVLDIHHNFIREGTYIQPSADHYARVIDSWRGVRPVIHYSMSREDCLVNHCVNTLPDLQALLAQGYKKQKMRAHSDFYWNHPANTWALSFLDTADIMCESKSKNIGSYKLYELCTPDMLSS
jgi:UV DNA damage endonuclease